MDLPTVLSSGVLAGLVAGLVSIRISERKIAIENITQQRQLWRERIRSLACDIQLSYRNKSQENLKSHFSSMQLLLNPEDDEDNSILDTLWEMSEQSEIENLALIFSEKLSLLLKHDWERAKSEAKPIFPLKAKIKRVSYKKFKSRCNCS